jgi:ribonuclease HI
MKKPMVKETSSVLLVTDGACKGNPGPGGWAVILRHGSKEKLLSGGEATSTNNRMELLAVIEGLGALKKKCNVHIQTDSKYVMDAFEKKWIDKWEANGWKTAAKEPVKNRELWERLIELVDSHNVTWEWVRGHSGHADNERVDEEAQRQADLFGR